MLNYFKCSFLVLLLTESVLAASPNIDLLTQAQADSISKEFSANFVHSIVAPASTLGDVFGVEIGLVGGLTSTPETDALSRSFDASASVDKIPHAGVFGSVSLPYGFTGELSLIPEAGSTLKIEHKSYAVKWTFSDFLDLPVDIAVRVHGSNSTLSYEDTINNSSTSNVDVNSTISYDMSSLGAHLTLSKNFVFVEPYVGIGTISTDTDIKTTASSTVSIFTFTGAESYSSSNSGTHFFVGANLNLFVLKIGLEHSKVVDISRTTAKLSFYF
jgi:hypothetical protein